MSICLVLHMGRLTSSKLQVPCSLNTWLNMLVRNKRHGLTRTRTARYESSMAPEEVIVYDGCVVTPPQKYLDYALCARDVSLGGERRSIITMHVRCDE